MNIERKNHLLLTLIVFVIFGNPLHILARAERISAPFEMSNRQTISKAQGHNPPLEKQTRTAAQKKIDSQLLYALYRQRGEAKVKGVPPGEFGIKYDEKGRAIVSIRARVTKTLLAKIKSFGGKIISSSERYRDIQAYLPLDKLEETASLKDVYAIMPAEEAITNSTQQ